MFAVIDLETTGFNPLRHDRVCEIAIISVNAEGEITDEWCTLVNPQRDLGPQSIHGIPAADARRAPVFADLAGAIAERLADRIVVAHNLMFDANFLRAEFARAGYEVPLALDLGLCTMRLAPRFLPLVSRRLSDCCLAARIELVNAHSALDDARAAAKLLGYYISEGARFDVDAPEWPHVPASGAVPVQRRAPGEVPDHFLARLVERLPREFEPPQADQYLSYLDMVLVDRHVSETEGEALAELAMSLGMDKAAALSLHRRYLAALAAETQDLRDDELDELHRVAELLGLAASDVDSALAEPSALELFHLTAGDEVVFTGQTAEPREVWEERARAAGLVVANFVTQQTRLVVAADPDSLSGKARQARRFRIPIVRIGEFERLVRPS